MATAALKGSASFSYTPYGTFTVLTHGLAIPLYNIRIMDRRVRYDWWAEDLNTREVVNIGDGVREIQATIRLDNEPTELRYMLQQALQYDLVLTYTASTGSFPVRLVAVLEAADADETPLVPDRDRYGYGEWECRVHLRRTDGGTLDAILS